MADRTLSVSCAKESFFHSDNHILLTTSPYPSWRELVARVPLQISMT
jgi:hypothetical protein